MDSCCNYAASEEAIAGNPEASEALCNGIRIVEANQNLEKSMANLNQIFEDLKANPAAIDRLIKEPIVEALLDRQLEKMWEQERQDYFNKGLKKNSTKKSTTEGAKKTDVSIPLKVSQYKVFGTSMSVFPYKYVDNVHKRI